MSQVASEHLGESLGTDFFSVREQFTDEQWSHFITVRRFVDEEVVPVVGPYWERAEICWPLVKRLPELGIVGEDIQGYGCAGMSPMACGLVTMGLHRGDGSLGVLDYQVARHMADLEAIHTFEGTETMQTLIVGRAITGPGAFA
jgi:alkylation response protein AidB-like acyl-CoA dehydrogenase